MRGFLLFLLAAFSIVGVISLAMYVEDRTARASAAEPEMPQPQEYQMYWMGSVRVVEFRDRQGRQCVYARHGSTGSLDCDWFPKE